MNKYFNIAIVTALSVAITSFKGNAMSDLSQYVDPFIGVDGGGNVFPGPCVPFGMVKVGPDCGGKDWNAGWDRDGNIHGFSNVHVSGTGGGCKYGNVLGILICKIIHLLEIMNMWRWGCMRWI